MDKHHLSDKNSFFNGLNIADELIDSDLSENRFKKSRSHENRFKNISQNLKNKENSRKNSRIDENSI